MISEIRQRSRSVNVKPNERGVLQLNTWKKLEISGIVPVNKNKRQTMKK